MNRMLVRVNRMVLIKPNLEHRNSNFRFENQKARFVVLNVVLFPEACRSANAREYTQEYLNVPERT